MPEAVVLFGGGDAGGFMILNGRIIRIPPYDPETNVGRAESLLSAANALVQAAAVDKGLSAELNQMAQKIAGQGLAQLAGAVAPGAQAKTA